jgi:hypothetical protein
LAVWVGTVLFDTGTPKNASTFSILTLIIMSFK